MKKRIGLICVLLLMLLLSGCCKNHEWTSATCTEPRTCSNCGETEGEALGHSWQVASFQSPKTCTACGVTEGEPRIPAFVEHGLVCDMKLGETYDYLTGCSEDDSGITTMGTVRITEARECDAGEREELTPEEGYSWYCVNSVLTFSDENAQAYGVSVGTCSEDYYDIILHDETIENVEPFESEYFYGCRIFTVNWNGVDYDKCLQLNHFEWSDWIDKVVTRETTHYIRIPTGYDGWVGGFYNGLNSGDEFDEGKYIFDYADKDSHFFRLIP